MSSQHLCPFCASPLLCQIIDGYLSWYCRHCHLEIPYGICQEIPEQERTTDSIAQIGEESTRELLAKTWKKTVTEIKDALNADRVMLWKYSDIGELKVLEEALNPDYSSLKDWTMGHFFTKQELDEFTQGKLQIRANLSAEAKKNLLESFFEVKAKLIVPIILPDDHHIMPKLWGLLFVSHCAKEHDWQESEIKLISIIAKQIGVNIEQFDNFHKLKLQYQKLEKLSCIYKVTGLKSPCQLERYLEEKWQEMMDSQQHLSIIIGKIHGLAMSKHIWGEQAEEISFKQIARVISNVCQNTENIIVKNDLEDFVIVLPGIDGTKAVKLAETMGKKVQDLQLRPKPEYLTISFGIASAIPSSKITAKSLLTNAQNALNNGQSHSENSLTFGEYKLE
jgi:diguanylate cyclase (GGDEF)-like protein